MKVLGYIQNNSGVTYHRVQLPLMFFPDWKVLLTNNFVDEVFAEGWDIVVFNRFTHLDIRELLYFKEKYKFKLICDIDDSWILNPKHLLYPSWKINQTDKRILAHVIASDYVTTTHTRLAKMIEKYNPNVFVLPNALPYGWEQFRDNKTESDKVRLFWAGGSTHEHDINLLANPLKRIYDDRNLSNKIDMVFGGYVDDTIRNKMVKDFTYNEKLSYKIYEGLPVDKYMYLYSECDIALIPLENNDFNSHKSILKILEAAAKKVPVVVSSVKPYTDVPEHLCNWVHNKSDWYKHIKRLVNDKEERQRQGELLYQWASTYFNLSEINKERKYLYEGIVNNNIGE